MPNRIRCPIILLLILILSSVVVNEACGVRLFKRGRGQLILETDNEFSHHLLDVTRKFPIFADGIRFFETMVQNVGLNQAQMDFLRLLSHFNTEEQVKELNDLVCQYYARKVDEEMDRLWDEGKWNQEKIEETLKEHLRTPYNV